jgi:two-component system chemotaxis sensor kinase CheA
MLLVVVRVRNEKLALAVDDLLDERDMVIKPLPEHMRRLTVVSGMVITGRNELVSVLHAPALLELARHIRSQASRTEAAGHAGEQEFAYKILVVDDSLNTREIEKDVLEAWGYRVTLAEDGVDGLQQARMGTFDAILTDVEMPNMDGFTLTSMLRQEEKYRDTPIVIITSREKEEDKRRGIQVGADAYIVKGEFDQTSLVDTLRSLLG